MCAMVVLLDRGNLDYHYHDTNMRRTKTEVLIQLHGNVKRIFFFLIFLIDSKFVQSILLVDDVDKLDAALRRRFEKRIFMGLPTKEERLQLLNKYVKNHNLTDSEMEEIADQTDKYTRGELYSIATNLQEPIQLESVLQVLKTHRRQCTDTMLEKLNKWKDDFG
jgi:AAA+ superfamily predicted ATPase